MKFCIYFFSIWFSGAALFAAVDAGVESKLHTLLGALEHGSLEEFTAPGDGAFKAAMTDAQISAIHSQLGQHFEKGYKAEYLGQLKQRGCDVYLFKVSFTDGSDDLAAKLVLRGGKVAGFWIQ